MSTDAMRAALAEMEDAINCEGFGCACYVGYQCHTCRARDVLEKTVRKPFDKLRAALAQPSVSRDAFCWLVELFEGDGSGNSAGWYHTGFTDIGGHARTTKNLHDARRYRTREQAEQVAAKLGHTLTGTWRAVEHGFQVRVQPSVPDKRDALLLAANCCESIYAPAFGESSATGAGIVSESDVGNGPNPLYGGCFEGETQELADLRRSQAAQIAALKTVMIAAAEEIAAHWEAHCDAEGYGPQNLLRRLEEGIPSEYGYTAGAFAALTAERDAAEDALLRKGYRKSCDIPACNCGDQWNHGGNAAQRLSEIGEALRGAGFNGGTLLGNIQSLIALAARASLNPTTTRSEP